MKGQIQINMFEVQLGAAMLLQFKGESGIVRVLADAGIKASGYKPDHVLKKLRKLIPEDRRIDLVIGTHYDEDHLNGLVPIIEDEHTAIGEVWLPPVPNDTEIHPMDQALVRSNLLPHQLAGKDGEAVLHRYLKAKRQDIEIFILLERALGGAVEDHEIDIEASRLVGDIGNDLDASFFRDHLRPARSTNDPLDHGCDDELTPHPDVEDLVAALRSHRGWYRHFNKDIRAWIAMAVRKRADDPEGALQQKSTISNLRRTVAKEAINVQALYKVIDAIRARSKLSKPIKIRTEWITDGTPARYAWNDSLGRFAKGKHTSAGPHFELLGPSVSLVEKHQDRLHPRDAALVAFEFRREIRSITPSNQLSYIGCFKYLGQAILMSGDAGCVDFSLARNQYYPALLDALRPLHVVQVAHHAGNNAHFYRVLAASNYTQDASSTYLLLSHATLDTHRPSDQFSDFISDTANFGGNPIALFTSHPKPEKIDDFLMHIHSSVGRIDEKGDIQLSFECDWTVDAHAISVH